MRKILEEDVFEDVIIVQWWKILIWNINMKYQYEIWNI